MFSWYILAMSSVGEKQITIDMAGERLKQNLLSEIKKLDNFPKTNMFIPLSGGVEPRWGVPVKRKFNKNFFSEEVLVTWHGIYIADLVDAFSAITQIQPEKYPDFESMREATPEEYCVYYEDCFRKIKGLVTDQERARGIKDLSSNM